MNKKDEMKAILVWMPTELRQKLKIESVKKNTTMSEIIRELIKEKIQR